MGKIKKKTSRYLQSKQKGTVWAKRASHATVPLNGMTGQIRSACAKSGIIKGLVINRYIIYFDLGLVLSRLIQKCL
jgi:hypothetical protein